jgi:hypothetical protein
VIVEPAAEHALLLKLCSLGRHSHGCESVLVRPSYVASLDESAMGGCGRSERDTGQRTYYLTGFMTDAEGRFTIDPCPPGEYTLRFRAEGCEEKTLEKVVVQRGKVTWLGDVVRLTPSSRP